MDILIVTKPISLDKVKALAKICYGTMVKGVVDVEKGIMALGGEFHRDANDAIIESGSKQTNIWGFNIYPFKKKENWLEYNSLINIRPAQSNSSMDITDQKLREIIRGIFEKLIIT
jgi:hypothetical protein